jgi:AcrR family transcriptional regulator
MSWRMPRIGSKQRKSAQRAPDETNRALVAAAAKLFNSVGYFGTDSNRIAREAGYAPGTFYNHFPDKLGIFLEVYRQWVEAEWQAIAAAIATKSSPTSERARIAGTILEHHRKWRIFRASLRALTATDARVRQARLAQREGQIAQTAELLRARGTRASRARIYASLLLFEILCDAVADGDTVSLGIKDGEILACLEADTADLLGAKR